ncbi:MAG: hypothetical protein C4560_05060 [Nitrospiraceae bacterium]|nr:MAG: hypothetical protein C4560_05060 [Nitrospiraceae bacterium]
MKGVKSMREAGIMTINEAVSEMFWRALKELPKKEREGVVTRMARDKEFITELLGAIIEQRGKESADSSFIPRRHTEKTGRGI